MATHAMSAHTSQLRAEFERRRFELMEALQPKRSEVLSALCRFVASHLPEGGHVWIDEENDEVRWVEGRRLPCGMFVSVPHSASSFRAARAELGVR